MTWNHRVVKRKGLYSIREVYYGGQGCTDDPCTRKVVGWTGPLTLDGYESKKAVKKDLKRMLSAFDRPVLEVK